MVLLLAIVLFLGFGTIIKAQAENGVNELAGSTTLCTAISTVSPAIYSVPTTEFCSCGACNPVHYIRVDVGQNADHATLTEGLSAIRSVNPSREV